MTFYLDTQVYDLLQPQVYVAVDLNRKLIKKKSKCCGIYVLHYPATATAFAIVALAVRSNKKVTLEEILALRHVWITLRQQLHECLSPGQGRVVGQLLK